jgi:homoserine dehydrogenase
MCRYPIAVLKFGSSVLACEADVSKAVQEIYRWTRDGHRVVAVVSAIGPTTDALLARARTYGSNLSDEAVATLVATGEATSAALLTLALERAGLHSVVVDEVRLGLRTHGPLLNAEPCAIEVPRLLGILNNASVAVVPGFVGRQEDGTLSLLGRGGSDLTAVFVAHHLRADRCRLVKDVNGIYEHDPANTVNLPRRYSTVSWAQAVRVGNGVVQPRAIEFAGQHGLAIEVATLNSDSPTLICGLPISFADQPPSAAPLRIGLLGAGTVGLGVYRTLAAHPETFDVRRVAVRRLQREDEIPQRLLTHDPWELVSSDCEVVIELIGGLFPAKELIEAALKSGKHVITANKLVVGRYGKHLRRIAGSAGVQLLYSAAVGGGVPMLEQVARIARTNGIRTLHGVVNGTTNFILDRLAEGLSREEALGEAQRLGFAEQDPTSDLDGSDAAHKLALLAQTAFGVWLNPADIERIGIEHFDCECVQDIARSGRAVRLVASLSRDAFGLRARIAPQLFERAHTFARTINEENCLEIESQNGEVVHVRGKGAGRWPTAVSVMADVCDVYRAQHLSIADECFTAGRAS